MVGEGVEAGPSEDGDVDAVVQSREVEHARRLAVGPAGLEGDQRLGPLDTVRVALTEQALLVFVQFDGC